MISTKATNTQAEMTFNPSKQHVSNHTCKPYMVGTYFSEDVKKCHFNNGASEQNAGISKQCRLCLKMLFLTGQLGQ